MYPFPEMGNREAMYLHVALKKSFAVIEAFDSGDCLTAPIRVAPDVEHVVQERMSECVLAGFQGNLLGLMYVSDFHRHVYISTTHGTPFLVEDPNVRCDACPQRVTVFQQ